MVSLKTLDEEIFPDTYKTIQEGLSGEVSPGFVFGYWNAKDPDVVKASALGDRRRHPSVQDLSIETVFDVASLTKVFATTPLIGMLVDRSWIHWNDPVQKFIPNFPYREITIDHLMKHTSGYPAWKPFYEKFQKQWDRDTLPLISVEQRQALMREWVIETETEAQPGELCVYSDLSFLLLGFIIEEILQSPLDECVQRYFWNDLPLNQTRFVRTSQEISKLQNYTVAATEECPWRKTVLQGQVHDDNTWAMGGYAGHAGVFSNLPELFEMFLHLIGGYWSRNTLEEIFERDQKFGRARGYDCPTNKSSTGHFFSKNSVGHLGFTGVSFWYDRQKEIAVCLLSNRVHPSRENVKIKDFRPRFHDSLMRDLKLNFS